MCQNKTETDSVKLGNDTWPSLVICGKLPGDKVQNDLLYRGTWVHRGQGFWKRSSSDRTSQDSSKLALSSAPFFSHSNTLLLPHLSHVYPSVLSFAHFLSYLFPPPCPFKHLTCRNNVCPHPHSPEAAYFLSATRLNSTTPPAHTPIFATVSTHTQRGNYKVFHISKILRSD